MAETLALVALVALVVAGGVVLFLGSIGIGMVLGRRMDRALEARAAAGETGSAEEVHPDE
jgi:hypothetical protein